MRIRAGRSIRTRVPVLAVFLVLLGGLACGLTQAFATSSSPSPASSPSSGKIVLRVGFPGTPDNLNPFIGTYAQSYLIFAVNYDQLVGIDAATLAPSKETGLAMDWSVSDDGRTWTFKLRDTAKWQDTGQPVTAEDVAFTYDYIIDNQMMTFLSYVQGIKRVTVVGPYTLTMTCTKPKADMLLALNAIPILPEHIWSDVPPKLAGTTYPNEPPIIGSGAFQCVKYKKNSYVMLEANKEYWRGAPHIDQLLFQFYTNRTSVTQDFQLGTLDACIQLQDAQLPQLASTPGLDAQAIRVNGYDCLAFNCYEPSAGGSSLGNPVLRDWRFRQALQWAVDKEKIAAVACRGNARPADTVITAGYYTDPDWHWTPPADQAYDFDLAKAGALLSAAGYPLQDGARVDKQGRPIALRLWATTGPVSQAEGKMVAGWFRQLGLTIEFQVFDGGALLDRVYNMDGDTFVPDYDMWIGGWYNPIDPGQGLSYFCTDQINGWSDSAYSNPEFDKLFVEQSQTTDTGARKAIIDRMQQIVYEESPYVVLTYFSDTEGWNTAKWTGWVHSPARFGSVVNQSGVLATYLNVRPKAATTEGRTSGGTTTIWLVVIAAVAVVGAVIVMLLRRRGSRAVEE